MHARPGAREGQARLPRHPISDAVTLYALCASRAVCRRVRVCRWAAARGGMLRCGGLSARVRQRRCGSRGVPSSVMPFSCSHTSAGERPRNQRAA
jgi:hypothetical protein